MRDVALHAVTLLKFYARNRLILAFTMLVLVIWGLGMVPMFLYESAGGRFETLKYISSQLHGLVWIGTAGLGLFAVWSHANNRTTSLVFTRPGRPEAWTAGVFLSAFAVAVVAHAAAFALTAGLSAAWHIPLQTGFLWTTLDAICESVIIISALTALATAIHPVIAIIAIAVFSEGMLYSLDTFVLGYMKGRPVGAGMRLVEWLIRAVHATVPMLNPFSGQTASVESSLRALPADWGYLAATASYAAVAFLFFFLFADHFMR